jgi:hypothetical protein
MELLRSTPSEVQCNSCGAEWPYADVYGKLRAELGLRHPSPALSAELEAWRCDDCREDADDVLENPLLINMAEAKELGKEPLDYPVYPIAARGFLTVLAGRPEALKSWLMLITGHVAHRGGGEIGDLTCDATRTLLVDAENGARLLGRRFNAAQIPADGVLVADGTQLRLPDDIDRLSSLIEDTGAGLVVIDSLRRIAPGVKENDSDDMAPLIAELGTLARDTNAAVVLIHHRSTKKNAATLRGSSGIEDQADLVFTLEHPAGDRDRERRRLKAEKFRIDVKPGAIWLNMGMQNGRFTVSSAERYEGGSDDGEEQSAEEQLVERIEALTDQVRADGDGGWTPARLAAAVGSKAQSGTFKRALSLLLGRGTWTGTGRGRSRRLRPSTESGQPGQPLGNGPIGPIEEQADE